MYKYLNVKIQYLLNLLSSSTTIPMEYIPIYIYIYQYLCVRVSSRDFLESLA